jgi:magnesium chelatase family protein
MTPRLLKQHCALDSDSQQIIRQAITELHLSARAYDQVLKSPGRSRTILVIEDDDGAANLVSIPRITRIRIHSEDLRGPVSTDETNAPG